MDPDRFNTLVRAIAPSRRSMLSALQGTNGGFARNASRETKSKGQDCGKSAEARCKSDAELCRAILMGQCQGPPEICLPMAACCDTCSADGMFTCLLAQQGTLEARPQ